MLLHIRLSIVKKHLFMLFLSLMRVIRFKPIILEINHDIF